MDNLRDYIGWMGDYDFDRVPFGDIDAMILCLIAYYDLSALFDLPHPKETTLSGGLALIQRGACPYTAFSLRDMDYAAFLREAAASTRYGDLILSDYVDIARADPPLQFAAVSFRFGDFTFIAYRGTDMTLAGWREDFMISFTATEAQALAADYAARHVAKGGRFRLGGHSKGGNLALFAACRLDDDLWSRIEEIYLLDSPGLCPGMMDADRVERVRARALAIDPVFSVVGKLFELDAAQRRVVKSSGFSLLQHSLGSWGVDHGRPALAKAHDPASRWIDEVLRQWIDGIPQERRALFVGELFDALSAGGAVTLADILKAGPAGFRAVLAGLLKTSRAVKFTAAELPMRALLGESYDRLAGRIFPKNGDREST